MERRSSIDPKARAIYEQAVEKWGDEAQVIQSLEELSELSKALCKLFRGGSWDDVWQEMADVEITLEQLKVMSNHTDNEYKIRKLARIKKKLETGAWIPFEKIPLHSALEILETEVIT